MTDGCDVLVVVVRRLMTESGVDCAVGEVWNRQSVNRCSCCTVAADSIVTVCQLVLTGSFICNLMYFLFIYLFICNFFIAVICQRIGLEMH